MIVTKKAYQPHLQEGVSTGVNTIEHQQHIVHCQFHRPCVANVLNRDRAIQFAHLFQAHPVLYTRSAAILDLGHNRTQPLPPALDKKKKRGLNCQGSVPEVNKQTIPNRKVLVAGAPESHILNCHSASLESDSKTQPHLIAQDSSILDYSPQ